MRIKHNIQINKSDRYLHVNSIIYNGEMILGFLLTCVLLCIQLNLSVVYRSFNHIKTSKKDDCIKGEDNEQ